MIDFWHRVGLLLFIIGVAGLWENYSEEYIKLFSALVLIIGTLLNLMPDSYFGLKKEKNENKL